MMRSTFEDSSSGVLFIVIEEVLWLSRLRLIVRRTQVTWAVKRFPGTWKSEIVEGMRKTVVYDPHAACQLLTFPPEYVFVAAVNGSAGVVACLNHCHGKGGTASTTKQAPANRRVNIYPEMADL